MTTAAYILWHAADRPAPENPVDMDGECWWCGQPWSGTGRALASLSTKPSGSASPNSTALCAPCGWSMSDWVALPAHVGGPLLTRALDGNGRSNLVLPDGAQKVLACRVDGGRVAVYSRPRQGDKATEGRWLDGREQWASAPSDAPVLLLGVYDEHAAAGMVCGKFRNYDHIGGEGVPWQPLKVQRAEDRGIIRDLLLHPPAGPWACVIGDGQKHRTRDARASRGDLPVQTIRWDAGQVAYRPDVLGSVVAAVEALRAAGVRDSDIEAGTYSGAHLRTTLAAVEPTLRRWRGAPLFAIALALARRSDEIPPHDEVLHEPPHDDPPPGNLPGPVLPAPSGAGLAPAGGTDEPAPGQLALFPS